MTVSIRGTLPKGDKNGLAHVESLLAQEPGAEVVIMARVRVKQITENVGNDDNPFDYKLGVVHIEAVLDPADKSWAVAQLNSTMENRTGKPTLPFGSTGGDTVDRG